MDLKAAIILDAKGLACPMPIVKTRKAMEQLEPGKVIEVQATDRGSEADLQAWAESSGHQYLGILKEGNILRHFLRKSPMGERHFEKKHPQVIDPQELEKRIQTDQDMVVLDVREAAEYAFRHIPNAISIPLDELEERMDELNKHQTIYVICRTGQRSDLAAQQLTERGFSKVINVVPGMSQWTGETSGVESL